MSDGLRVALSLTYDHVVSWDAELSALTTRIAEPLFKRPEPKAVFGDLVRGLLADVPRKNSWQLSDHLGHPTANRIEHLLSRAKWDADLLRNAVRGYAVEHLGRPDGVLIADDTAAIKKGVTSVGVAHQYCGLTGQIENCQVMPMLTYASAAGHAFINRRLYLPESWAGDAGRRAVAGVPQQVGFATKPHLVIDMLTEELSAATPFRYLAADSGYGRDPALRAFCHDRQISYVMAVPSDLPLLAVRGGGEPVAHVLDRLLAQANPTVWERRSCGQGSKGARLYDWAALSVTLAEQRPAGKQRDRQGPARPDPIPGPQVGRLAPARHHRHARPGLPGRHPRPPRRHTRRRPGKSPSSPGEPALIPPRLIRPSLAEIRRVFARLILPAADLIDHVLAWSHFRQHHQTRALISHYRRRGDPLPQIYGCSTGLSAPGRTARLLTGRLLPLLGAGSGSGNPGTTIGATRQ